MVTLKEIAKIIEHTSYMLTLLRSYCEANSDIIEVITLKHALDDIFKDVDKMHVKLINEEII